MAVEYQVEPNRKTSGGKTKQEKQQAKELEKRKKVFNEVKNMSNVDNQAQEFGNFIDQRVSNPVTLGRKFTLVAQS